MFLGVSTFVLSNSGLLLTQLAPCTSTQLIAFKCANLQLRTVRKLARLKLQFLIEDLSRIKVNTECYFAAESVCTRINLMKFQVFATEKWFVIETWHLCFHNLKNSFLLT